MPLLPGEEPVDGDEIVYRRIPLGCFDAANRLVAIAAFKPRSEDTTGLSVTRAKYHPCIEDVARNPRGRKYYVAVLKVSELRARGIEVAPRPLHADDPHHPDYDPGHAELPQITYSQRHTNDVMQLMEMLATELCSDVQGPFP